MKKILITRCSDRHLWYNDLVGEYVPLLREYDDCYMSREPAGFANIVRKEDGQLVVEEEDI
jgi:hypothetical protein